MLGVVRCCLCAGYRLLSVACCLLLLCARCGSPFAVRRCSLLVVSCLLSVVYCLFLCRLLCGVNWLLLIAVRCVLAVG